MSDFNIITEHGLRRALVEPMPLAKTGDRRSDCRNACAASPRVRKNTVVGGIVAICPSFSSHTAAGFLGIYVFEDSL